MNSNDINEQIKRAGEKTEYTQEQIQEIIKCSNDYLYFIENYIYITDLDSANKVLFKVYPAQKKKILEPIHNNRFTIIMASRRCGKTTCTISYFLWCLTFKKNFKIGVLANKQELAKEILETLKDEYLLLPEFLKQCVVKWNTQSIEFENGSSITAQSTTKDSARGKAFNIIYCDEFAFVDRSKADGFIRSTFPTILSGTTTKFICTSTPNGLNHFYRIWDNAIHHRSNFYASFLKYNEIEKYSKPEWKEMVTKQFGENAFKIEYECEFIGSNSTTLIASETLRNLSFNEPIKVLEDGKIKIYKEPVENHNYITTCDIGMGREKNNSTFTIIDVTTKQYEVVCVFKDNQVETQVYPEYIAKYSKIYNNAYVLVEINKGGEVAVLLKEEIQYENMFFVESDPKTKDQKISLSYKRKSKYGIETSAKTKRIGCQKLKELIENGTLIYNDLDILSELSTFVKKGTSYAAESEDVTDDLVMCLVIFAWITTQKLFLDFYQSNMRNQILAEKQANDNTGIICITNFTNNDRHIEGLSDNWITRDGKSYYKDEFDGLWYEVHSRK